MVDSAARCTTDSVAQRVLNICKKTDDEAKITYVGRDEDDRTIVRVSSSAASSVSALQRALADAMPLARVRASENTLNGSMSAQITVPTADDEWEAAFAATLARRPFQALRAVVVAILLVGVWMWASG